MSRALFLTSFAKGIHEKLDLTYRRVTLLDWEFLQQKKKSPNKLSSPNSECSQVHEANLCNETHNAKRTKKKSLQSLLQQQKGLKQTISVWNAMYSCAT